MLLNLDVMNISKVKVKNMEDNVMINISFY